MNIWFRCNLGWTGIHCDQCIKLPGCSDNGHCEENTPFTCKCNSSDWLGPLCDCPKCSFGKLEKSDKLKVSIYV